MHFYKSAVVCATLVMLFLAFFMPIIDYDELYRFEVAKSVGFSLKYVNSLIWLPIYQFIIALLRDLLLLRLFSVFCVVIASVVVKRVSGVLWGKKVAADTGVFYVLNPLIILYGSIALPESLTTLLLVTFTYFFSVKKHVLASFVLCLAVLTSYTAWVLIPFVLFYAFLKKEKTLVSYVFPIIFLVWWGFVNFQFTNNPLNFVSLAHFYYVALTRQLPMFANTPFSFLLFTVVYPISFTFPFYIYCFRKPKMVDVYVLSVYFVFSSVVLLVVGQVLGYVFGWARYFIPLIPFILTLGSNSTCNLKHRRLAIIVYFALSLISTILQIYYIYDFKNQMLNR